MLKAFTFAAVLLSLVPFAPAQAMVRFDPGTKIFRMDAGTATYVFGVNQRGELQQLYWGGRLGARDGFAQARPMPELASFDGSYTNTPQEYAGWGAGLFNEPALKVTFADGNRDLVLHYESQTELAHGFDVVLKDISRPIFVTLHYAMDPSSGILARSATIENRGAEPVTVEQAAAAAWALPAGHYTLNYLTGRWAGEWNLNQEPVLHGARVIESRRGSTGPAPPTRITAMSGLALWAGAGRGASRSSRTSWMQCELRAASILSILATCSSPARNWRHRSSMVVMRPMVSAAHRDSCTASSSKIFCRVHKLRQNSHCPSHDRSSTTPGKQPDSKWTRPARRRWRKRPLPSASTAL